MFKLFDNTKITKKMIRNIYEGNLSSCHYSLEKAIRKMIQFELNRFDDSYSKREIREIIINIIYDELKEFNNLSSLINYSNLLRIEPPQHIF